MKKKFTTTIDDVLIKKAKIKAVELDISVAELLERLLRKFLESTEG